MTGDDGILDDIQNKIEGLTDGGTGDSDPYDPTEEFTDDVATVPVESVEWPGVDATRRDLDADDWGVYGEGPPPLWDEFVTMLNEGRLGQLPAEIKPEAPTGWGESSMPKVRSAQKERGKHLYAHIGATPETMLRVEGTVGERVSGTDRKEFATHLEGKVEDYAERFREGDRPGRFFAFVDTDGKLTGPQEGRHRAAAAMLAGVEWVPTVVLRDTGGTFRRIREEWRKDDEPGHRKRYPGGEA